MNPNHPNADGSARDEDAADWQTHPFLEGLCEEHLAVMADCAMLTGFPAKQVVFRQGEIANRFYLVLQGHVALEAEVNGRSRVHVDSVAAGEVLGWSWLFPPYAWNFSARAIEPVRAVFFYGTWLRERCAIDPAFGYELMRRMAAVVIRRLKAARLQLIRFAPEIPRED